MERDVQKTAVLRLLICGLRCRYTAWRSALLSLFLPPLIVFFLLLTVFPIITSSFSNQRLAIAFVDLEGSSYFNTLVGIIEGTDSIKALIELEQTTLDEAMSSLHEQSLDAIVVFPDRFIADMVNGINNPVEVILNDVNPIKAVYIREFMESAADEITAVQSAINTVWHYRDLNDLDDNQRSTSFNSLVLDYMLRAFSRNRFFFIETVSNFRGAAPAEFYLISFLIIFLLMAPLTGIRNIFAERESLIPARLRTTGLSDFKIALYYLAPLLLQCLLSSFLFLALILVLHSTPFLPSTAFSSGISAQNWFLCFLCLFPLALAVSSVALFVSQFFQKFYVAELFLITGNIAMLLISGTLIPYAYLPDIFRYAGVLSLNKWFSDLLIDTLLGFGTAGKMLIMISLFLVFSAVLFLLSVNLIRRNYCTS